LCLPRPSICVGFGSIQFSRPLDRVQQHAPPVWWTVCHHHRWYWCHQMLAPTPVHGTTIAYNCMALLPLSKTASLVAVPHIKWIYRKGSALVRLVVLYLLVFPETASRVVYSVASDDGESTIRINLAWLTAYTPSQNSHADRLSPVLIMCKNSSTMIRTLPPMVSGRRLARAYQPESSIFCQCRHEFVMSKLLQ
jgi:hypothetical protein